MIARVLLEAFGLIVVEIVLLPGIVSAAADCTDVGTPGDDVFTVVEVPDEPGEVAPDAIICAGRGDDMLTGDTVEFGGCSSRTLRSPSTSDAMAAAARRTPAMGV